MKSSYYFADWHKKRESTLRLSTFEAESEYLNCHIIPYFSEVQLEEITPVMINEYCQIKLRSNRKDGKKGGLSITSVRKHLSIIRQSLNTAVQLGMLPVNPAASIKLPRQNAVSSVQTVFLNCEEAQKLLNAMENEKIYPAVVLSLYYGLRRSEVLGLKWNAVDFFSNTIQIQHTVVKNLTIQACDLTKTEHSHRKYQLTPEVKAMLENLKETHCYGEYIFANEAGQVWRPDYLTRKFQKIAKKAGIEHIRFHDLRHSTASILFDKGWSLEDVKNWLGHADIETTSNIYLHYSQSRKILLSNKLYGLFDIKM